jgi:hypothetical protein
MSGIDLLVYKLDEIRSRTGSFVCLGEDDRFVSKLCELVLSTPSGAQMHGFIKGLDFVPTDDLIVRSDMVGVHEEPRSMTSVFVPRDSKRTEMYVPYFIYALGKLDQNFRDDVVQRELVENGYDSSQVHLAPIIQKVGGARDSSGALGRERTVSFSATLDLDKHECVCNVVFGLPLLATRPIWKGSLQSATFSCQRFDPEDILQGKTHYDLRFEWEKSDRIELRRHDSLRRRFRQTHKAVLIPEKGIVFEELEFITKDVLFDVEPSHLSNDIYFPLPRSECEELIGLFGKVLLGIPRDAPETRGHRIDGILVRQIDGSWDSPCLVGFSPIWRK